MGRSHWDFGDRPQSSWLLAQFQVSGFQRVSGSLRNGTERWIYDVQMMWFLGCRTPMTHGIWPCGVWTCHMKKIALLLGTLDLNPGNLKATAVVPPSAALGSATCELPSWANSRFRFMSLVWEAQFGQIRRTWGIATDRQLDHDLDMPWLGGCFNH